MRLLSIVLASLLCTLAFADVDFSFFSSSGYVEAFFYPPHNEYDPNPSIPFKDRVVARYGLDTYATLSLQKYPRFYIYGNLMSLFGDSRPQVDYNYRGSPIVGIVTLGCAYRVNPHFDLGLASSEYHDFGGYVLGERLHWAAVTAKFHW